MAQGHVEHSEWFTDRGNHSLLLGEGQPESGDRVGGAERREFASELQNFCRDF